MLVLTRDINDIIFIGNDIKITYLSRKGNQIKIGIDAPPEIVILREEIKDHYDFNKREIK